jgi:3-oxocholest-4-en-26-oyl-CoA dehydrogenase alpha subunit
MDFDFAREEKEIIADVRAFIESEKTPDLVTETHKLGHNYGGPEGRKFIKKFAARGWLTPNWPKAYGGIGATAVLNAAIRSEMARASIPVVFVAAHMAGPIIMKFANETLKNKWLPLISSGKIEFALGYTEPQAGSDLSAIDIRAQDQGDHFLVNGQKSFNTAAHIADYHWLAAQTDPDAKRYHGMSMMIVDLKSPGIEIRPMITMAGWQTNEVFYNDVVVPKENLVGDMNHGFLYLMSALDYERMYPLAVYEAFFEQIVAYAKEKEINGVPLSKDPLIRQKLAQLKTELEVDKLLYYRLACMVDNDQIPNYEASMQKLFATETAQRITNTAMDLLGHRGLLKDGSRHAVLSGMAQWYYRTSVVETIYAGTSEIQRNIIALRGLKLPSK